MKKGYYFVVGLGMLLCLCPLVGMTVAETTETTEKKELAAFPLLEDENGMNEAYLQELGAYFEDHFAFRQYLVSADSWIESTLFQKSNIDNVIVGEDGWLFYKDTLNDYNGQVRLSDRAIENIAYNLSVMQKQIESQGSKFIFTIAPNKNSLYTQNMPYTCSYVYSDVNNRKLLEKALEQYQVNYVDLFDLFAQQEEVLYYQRDSHWNNKGAMLAYNAILDEAQWQHDTYTDCKYEETEDYIGDLNAMVYPEMELPETQIRYEYETKYEYINRGEREAVADSKVSVEDARVETVNDQCDGSLLMYRDSFGNAILPFMANAFGRACFVKATPYTPGLHMTQCEPDVVVVEKVERKLDELAYEPAVMSGARISYPKKHRTVHSVTSMYGVIPEANQNTVEVYGVLDQNFGKKNDGIYVGVKGKKLYQAFARTIENRTDYGYCAYLPKDELKGQETIQVFVKEGKDNILICEQQIDCSRLTVGTDTVPDSDLLGGAGAEKDDEGIVILVQEQGKEQEKKTTATSLAQMADRGEITLHEQDRVTPERETPLYDGEVVSVQRVVVKKKKEVKSIPYHTKKVTSDDLYVGEKEITNPGKKGKKVITYQVTYVDGEVEAEKVISEKVTKRAVDQVVTEGTKEKVEPTVAPAPAKEPAKEPAKDTGKEVTGGERTIVSKKKIYDCGFDDYYYEITYSDGTVEYQDA